MRWVNCHLKWPRRHNRTEYWYENVLVLEHCFIHVTCLLAIQSVFGDVLEQKVCIRTLIFSHHVSSYELPFSDKQPYQGFNIDSTLCNPLYTFLIGSPLCIHNQNCFC